MRWGGRFENDIDCVGRYIVTSEKADTCRLLRIAYPPGCDCDTMAYSEVWNLAPVGFLYCLPWLESKKGEWRFEGLDKLIGFAEMHRVEIFLALGLSPAWASARPTEKCAYAPGFAAEPRNIVDWRNYVRKVASRYNGRIHYYEWWNEPNHRGFYTGTMTKMLELVKEAPGPEGGGPNDSRCFPFRNRWNERDFLA